MPRLDSVVKTGVRKAIFGGPPGSGKTTAAMSAPGHKLLLQAGIGHPVVPPGVNVEEVFLRQYPPILPGTHDLDSDRWKRDKGVGAAIIDDFFNIREGVLEGKIIKLGGEELPWVLEPGKDTIIIDDWVPITQHIFNWVLAVNNVFDSEGFKNRYTAWGKRLNQLNIMLWMVLPLPVNVVVTCWTSAETKTKMVGLDKSVDVATGRVLLDMGGKLDIWGPGLVDTALDFFTDVGLKGGTRYKVKVRPDGVHDWIKIRGDFGERSVVDLTIDGKDKSLPWERLFRGL